MSGEVNKDRIHEESENNQQGWDLKHCSRENTKEGKDTHFLFQA